MLVIWIQSSNFRGFALGPLNIKPIKFKSSGQSLLLASASQTKIQIKTCNHSAMKLHTNCVEKYFLNCVRDQVQTVPPRPLPTLSHQRSCPDCSDEVFLPH